MLLWLAAALWWISFGCKGMPEEDPEDGAPPGGSTPIRSPSPDRFDLESPVDSEATVPETPSCLTVLALWSTFSPTGLMPRELTFEY